MALNQKTVKKFILIIVLLFLCIYSICTNYSDVSAQDDLVSDIDFYVAVDENGNVTYLPLETEEIKPYVEPETYDIVDLADSSNTIIESFDTYEEAKEVLDLSKMRKTRSNSVSEYVIIGNDEIRAINYGVVRFPAGVNTHYKNVQTGRSDGYTNGSYAPDAAYISTSSDGKTIRFKQAGVIGEVSASEVTIIPYTTSTITSIYTVSNGRLYHKLTTNMVAHQSTVQVGYMPSYMSNGNTYYSYDGHYFYTSYTKMIDDYRNGTYANSINPSKPYYNYFQYLTHRTKTNFTADQLDSFVLHQTNNNTSSKMNKLGDTFISVQNQWGVNGVLMYGVAANESAWGTSNIAKNKNNLFGHGAVDSNPYWGANGYASPIDSVKYHGEYFVSKGYTYIADWRYYGANLGDKQSGLNVKYASDPYWGEKAASQGYYLENYYGNKNIDYGKYTIGVTSGSINVRKEPNTSSTLLYATGQGTSGDVIDNPVVIIDTVTGSTVNGSNKWYKIQTDSPLTSNRNGVSKNSEYSFARDYAYIHSSNVKIVFNADGSNPVPTYLLGDVNGDGYISSKDYNAIKNHIKNTKILSGDSLSRADVNKDGYISSKDYNAIKNHITGSKPLS